MAAHPSTFAWHVGALPKVARAGRYPLEDRGFAYSYVTRTAAIHVYLYHGTIRIGAQQFTIAPGDLTLTPPGTPARYDLPHPGHHWCIHAYRPSRVGAHLGLPLHLRLGPNAAFAIERVRSIAHLRGSAGGELAEARAALSLQDLMLWLSAHAAAGVKSPLRSDVAVEKAAFQIDTHFAQPLSVPGLAEAVNVNQNHLARCFRRKMGVTIPRYLLNRRMEHAQFLLHSTDIPVHVIARRVGMPDPQHFNKQFRKLCGTSPSAWRTLSRQQREVGPL